MDGWNEKYALPIKVLEAGGSIESRMLLAGFTDRYVFTKEQLQQFMQNLKDEYLASLTKGTD
jgi:hypothetical protein